MAGKGGAAAPSDYSHSSGIWMSTQGLQRRRGHKYHSATAIFPAAPAARQLGGKAGLRPEGRVAGGWLWEGAGGEGTARGKEGKGKVREERERRDVSD